MPKKPYRIERWNGKKIYKYYEKGEVFFRGDRRRQFKDRLASRSRLEDLATTKAEYSARLDKTIRSLLRKGGIPIFVTPNPFVAIAYTAMVGDTTGDTPCLYAFHGFKIAAMHTFENPFFCDHEAILDLSQPNDNAFVSVYKFEYPHLLRADNPNDIMERYYQFFDQLDEVAKICDWRNTLSAEDTLLTTKPGLYSRKALVDFARELEQPAIEFLLTGRTRNYSGAFRSAVTEELFNVLARAELDSFGIVHNRWEKIDDPQALVFRSRTGNSRESEIKRGIKILRQVAKNNRKIRSLLRLARPRVYFQVILPGEDHNNAPIAFRNFGDVFPSLT